MLMRPTVAIVASLFAYAGCVRNRAPTMGAGGSNCPSCGQLVSSKNMRRHQAFCCPDLLDPEGWHAGDRETVLRHARAACRPGTFEAKLIQRRFGGRDPPSQQQLAKAMNTSPRRVRDTLSRFLRGIPPPPEVDETP